MTVTFPSSYDLSRLGGESGLSRAQLEREGLFQAAQGWLPQEGWVMLEKKTVTVHHWVWVGFETGFSDSNDQTSSPYKTPLFKRQLLCAHRPLDIFVMHCARKHGVG